MARLSSDTIPKSEPCSSKTPITRKRAFPMRTRRPIGSRSSKRTSAVLVPRMTTGAPHLLIPFGEWASLLHHQAANLEQLGGYGREEDILDLLPVVRLHLAALPTAADADHGRRAELLADGLGHPRR